ncbi:MAG: hypothetical protein Q9180_007076 [Flavoplaca navasiana]
MSNDDLQICRPERPTFSSQQKLEQQPQDTDPTSAYICLQTGRNADGPWTTGIASLDSGTREQWVSDTFLDRFSGTDIEWVSLEEPDTYVTFSGTEFIATKGVIFTWHTQESRKTRKGVFRVVQNGPFDVIIGSILLFSEGIYIFNKAALLFFHRPARRGEEERMQQTLARQDAEVHHYNVDLAAARASDRQRQRDNLEDGRPLQTGYTSSMPVCHMEAPLRIQASNPAIPLYTIASTTNHVSFNRPTLIRRRRMPLERDITIPPPVQSGFNTTGLGTMDQANHAT